MKTTTGLSLEPGAYGAHHHGYDVAHVNCEAIHFPGLLKYSAGVEKRELDVPAIGIGTTNGAALHLNGV